MTDIELSISDLVEGLGELDPYSSARYGDIPAKVLSKRAHHSGTLDIVEDLIRLRRYTTLPQKAIYYSFI